MINPLTDELIPMTKVADVLQMRHHPSTYVRWYLRGIRNVKLETVLLGGKRYTTRQALEEFFAATTSKTSAAVQSDSRQKRIEAAERELSGKRDTTSQALEQFFAAAPSKASIAEQSDSRKKSIEAAERELNSR